MLAGRAGSGRDTKEICAARRNFDLGPEAGKTWLGTGREAITKRSESATETNATWAGLRKHPRACMYVHPIVHERPTVQQIASCFQRFRRKLTVGQAR